MAAFVYPVMASNGTIETAIQTYATESLAKVNSAITSLTTGTMDALGTGYSTLDALVGFSSTADLLDPTDIDVTLPDDPTAPTISYPTVTTSTAATAPTLTMNTVATDEILIALIGDLQTEFDLLLGTGATGLPNAVESDLFNRARDRASIEAGAGYAKAQAAMAVRGFSRPQGADLTTLEMFTLESIAKSSDINREITIAQANLEQSNRQFATNALITFKNNLLQAKAGHESNKLRNFERVGEYYIGTIKAGLELGALKNSVYANSVQAYAAKGKITADKAQVSLAVLSSVNDAHEKLAQIAIEKIRMATSYSASKASLKQEGYKAAAAAAAQIASSSINGMNISYSFSGSNSKSETHSFEG